MKILRASLSLVLTAALIVLFNNRLPLQAPVPPLGKFLDPFNGFWQNCFESGSNGEHPLEGLKDKVEIVYDSLAVPHIYAQNEEDLYLAQGYVTAADRLWQMEFQIMAAAGRVSEILGPGKDSVYLNYDRDQRRMGMVFAAENFISTVEGDHVMKTLADHYSKGVNQYITQLEYKNLPVEYKLLDYSPEPWNNLKMALLLKSMARTLNTGEKDMEMTNALQKLGLEKLNLLYPDRERVGDPIVNRTGKWPKPLLPADTVPLALPAELVTVIPSEKTTKDIGSNNWAVAGNKTATGSPILCNDPHLTLSLPSIWYMIHLSAPGYNSMGASLPGSPGVISGFNDSIAWGVTNAQRDAVDWYRIRFKDNEMNEYEYDGSWRKTIKKIEAFKVRGKGILYDTITFTHHGPIRYDHQYKAENERARFAYRWLSHDGSDEMRTFYELNKAKNIDDYHQALNHFATPAQNFVFASVSGDIAMRIQGKFPVRRPMEGRFVLDGSKSFSEPQQFIPNDHNVQETNPLRGFVSSANQYPADSTYPYYITAGSYEAYRNRRINQRLAEMNAITPEDMMTLQVDNFSLKGQEALPLLLAGVKREGLSAEQTNILEDLSKWDLYYKTDSKAASYFESWWSSFYAMAWDEFFEAKPTLPVPTNFNTIRLMSLAPQLEFFDRVSTPEKETLNDIITLSFKEAVENVSKWKAEKGLEPEWGAYKGTTVEHLLRLEPLSRLVQAPGNREAVNATSRRGGPSWRMIVSLEKDGVKAWGIYPGGQSGHPGSKYYDNMIPDWTAGRFYRLPFSASSSAIQGQAKLILTPKN
jgi:penicillin amidase